MSEVLPYIEDYGLVIIALGIIGLMISTQFPKEWQTPAGWAIASFAIIPAGALIAALVAMPYLVPFAFIAGIYCVSRR